MRQCNVCSITNTSENIRYNIRSDAMHVSPPLHMGLCVVSYYTVRQCNIYFIHTINFMCLWDFTIIYMLEYTNYIEHIIIVFKTAEQGFESGYDGKHLQCICAVVWNPQFDHYRITFHSHWNHILEVFWNSITLAKVRKSMLYHRGILVMCHYSSEGGERFGMPLSF